MPNNIYSNNVISATSNPQANLQQLDNNQGIQPTNIQEQQSTINNETPINPITIPIQIQPQIVGNNYSNDSTNNMQNLQNNNNINSSDNTNNSIQPANNINTISPNTQNYINKVSNSDIGTVKKSSAGTTIVTPINADTNTLEGQYQSSYANTVNSLIAEMLKQMQQGFTYDPNEDEALKLAQEYASNSTLQSLAGSGVLNSTATAERVARIVSQLVVQYEEKAHDRWIEYLGNLANTAQVVMSYDAQQFQYWSDAKDREFKEKEFEFNKQQTELENTWKRVDELGFVDNEASALLGLKVGTLSKDAREAKEQREFELQKMREQAELEYENEKALAELRSQLDYENEKRLKQLQEEIDRNLYQYKSQLDYENERKLYEEKSRMDYENERKMYEEKARLEYENERRLYEEKANIDTQKSKELADYEYSLKQKYGTSTVSNSSSSSKVSSTSKTSSSSTNNLINYKQLIESSWGDSSGTVTQHNTEVYHFLQNEFVSGRLDESELAYLINYYKVRDPSTIRAHAFDGILN